MLNSCIRHKISHTQKLYYKSSPSHKSSKSTAPRESSTEHHDSPLSSLSFSQRQVSHQAKTTPIASTSSSDDEFYEAQEALDSDENNEKINEPLTEQKQSKETEPRDHPISLTPKTLELEPTSIDPLSVNFDDEEEIIQKSNIGQERNGALHQYKDLLLLATGEPLFVPETQVNIIIII